MQATTTLPNLLFMNRGNFYLFLLSFGLTSHFVQLSLILASGVKLIKSSSFFSQKITSITRHQLFFTSRLAKKVVRQVLPLQTHSFKSGSNASFWHLSRNLTHSKFYLIGSPYNKKRFAFLDHLIQNRVNPTLKVNTVRRYVFSKLRKAKIKFFLSALKSQKLVTLLDANAQSQNPRLKVRRATNLRSVNPYLFLVRRFGRRTSSQTYTSYLLLKRAGVHTASPRFFKRDELLTPKVTFYFWKRYLKLSNNINAHKLISRRFRKRWYRWKCLSLSSGAGRRSLRRSNFNRTASTLFKREAYNVEKYTNYSRLLIQPFKCNLQVSKSEPRGSSPSEVRRVITGQASFFIKRAVRQKKLYSLNSKPVRNQQINRIKATNIASINQRFITTSDLLFLAKRFKRRSFKRNFQLQLKAKRNYVNLSRKWGYSSAGARMLSRADGCKLTTWKYRVFWTKRTWLKGPTSLLSRFVGCFNTPVLRLTTLVNHAKGPFVGDLSLFSGPTRALLMPILFTNTEVLRLRTGVALPRRTKFAKQHLAPTFAKTFMRHTFFFLHLFKGPLLKPNLSTKAEFFKTSYTFVNTSVLKRGLLRRVVRTSLHLKRLFSPKYSTHQNKSPRPNSGPSVPLGAFRTQVKLTLPSYTNFRTSRIPRIRFKPGYSRQWRFFRSDVKHFLSIKTRYQYRLTTLIQRLFHSNRKANDWDMQTKITPFLVQSRLVPDFWSASELVKSSSVFVNGYMCTNTFLNVCFSDFVQLIISIKYYIVNKWLINWSLRNSTRILQLNRKFAQKRRTDGLGQKPKPLPNWIFRIRYSNYDVPRYVEVDFFTLSVFVVRNTNSLANVTSVASHDTQFKIFNMYNWKYIT